jgi:inosine-uridine nucleoside N-ribohydrolase
MKTQFVTSMLALSLLTTSAFMGGMNSARAEQAVKDVPVAASTSTAPVAKSANKPLKKERRKMKKEVKTTTTTDQGTTEKKAN